MISPSRPPTLGNSIHAGPSRQGPPSQNFPRNLQRELVEVFNNGLGAGPDVGQKKKGKWAPIESRALIAILNDGDNYATMQRSPRKFWGEVAKNEGFFHGSRSATAIKAHWDEMRKRYYNAKQQVDYELGWARTEANWKHLESGELSSSRYAVYSSLMIT